MPNVTPPGGGLDQSDILSDGTPFDGSKIDSIFSSSGQRGREIWSSTSDFSKWEKINQSAPVTLDDPVNDGDSISGNTGNAVEGDYWQVIAEGSRRQERRLYSNEAIDLTNVDELLVDWQNTGRNDNSTDSAIILDTVKDSYGGRWQSSAADILFYRVGAFDVVESFDLSDASGEYYVHVHAKDDDRNGPNESNVRVDALEFRGSGLDVRNDTLSYVSGYGITDQIHAISPLVDYKRILEWLSFSSNTHRNGGSVTYDILDDAGNVLQQNIESGNDLAAPSNSPIRVRARFNRDSTSEDPSIIATSVLWEGVSSSGTNWGDKTPRVSTVQGGSKLAVRGSGFLMSLSARSNASNNVGASIGVDGSNFSSVLVHNHANFSASPTFMFKFNDSMTVEETRGGQLRVIYVLD